MQHRARSSTIATLLAIACGEADDELDPAVVSALSLQIGDASGSLRSGEYVVTITPEACGECPTYDGLGDYTLCPAGEATGPLTATLRVVQTDGIVMLSYHSNAATGPIDGAGPFAAGAVVELDMLLVEGSVVLRVDGAFAFDGGTQTLEATVRSNIDVRVVTDYVLAPTGVGFVPLPPGETSIEHIRCRETLSMSGLRVSELP